jgi:hypothetical protein
MRDYPMSHCSGWEKQGCSRILNPDGLGLQGWSGSVMAIDPAGMIHTRH